MRERFIDDDGYKCHIKYSADVEPVLDENKRWQNEIQTGAMRKIASIPPVVIMKWCEEDGVFLLNMAKRERELYLRRKLNDPDWQYLKSIPGMA